MTIDLRDDLLHPRTEDPYWNESAAFTFNEPGRDLSGYVYFYHRPNMGLSAGGPALWDPSGADIYDCRYWDWDPCLALPPGAEMHDFTLDNGLSVETLRPGCSYRFGYRNDGCEVDLAWEAIMEPFEILSEKPESVNPGIDAWVTGSGQAEIKTGHYAQCGRMRGTVNLDGETIPIDSYSFRDRSWGPRRVQTFPRVGWLWAVADEGNSFHVVALSGHSGDDDPVAGTSERIVHGWYTHDGVLARVVTGERHVASRGGDGRPLRQVIDATDELGRRLRAEGTVRNTLRWTGYGRTLNYWALAEWAWADRQGFGEAQEVSTFRHGRRYRRSLRGTG